jgi:DnaJ-class molecular chaperone
MPLYVVGQCEECKGSGVVTVRYEWRGVVGDGEAQCPVCGGTGKVKEADDGRPRAGSRDADGVYA